MLQHDPPFSPAAFDGELTDAEAGHLAYILQQPVSLAAGQRAMGDYIEIILENRAKAQSSADPASQLLALQQKLKQKQKTEDMK